VPVDPCVKVRRLDANSISGRFGGLLSACSILWMSAWPLIGPHTASAVHPPLVCTSRFVLAGPGPSAGRCATIHVHNAMHPHFAAPHLSAPRKIFSTAVSSESVRESASTLSCSAHAGTHGVSH
jgi:hypothetical protein